MPVTSREAGGLICLCGTDGSGKTSHARHLASRLHAAGVRAQVIVTVPRDGDFLPILRDVQDHASKQTIADLIAFERLRQVRRLVEPALARHETVICDRYFYTDVVYAEAHGCDPSLAHALLALAPQPNAAIILQAPLEVMVERRAVRAPAPGWAPPHEAQLLHAVALRFDELASEPGFTRIDTDRAFSVVSDEVYRVATRAIGLGPGP